MGRAYLCSGCGQVMGRMLGVCPICRGKNLVFFDSDRSPALLKQQSQIQGKRRSVSTPAQANILVSGLLTIIMGAGYFLTNHWDEIVSHPAITRTFGVTFSANAAASIRSDRPARQGASYIAAAGQRAH